MTQLIIGIAGKKGSGKSTLSNILHGHQLMSYKMINSFDITPDGKLLVEVFTQDENGVEGTQKGEIDVTRLDPDFAEYAIPNIWPFVKHYAFATPVKEMLVDFFDLQRDHVYGTDEQKNLPTQYKWEDMPFNPENKKGFMTNREMMQFFGTEIFRAIKNNVWVDFAVRMAKIEQSQLAIFSDLRFVNEAECLKKEGAIIIKLVRDSDSNDSHQSEKEVEQIYPDLEINNTNLTPVQTYQKVMEFLDKNGYIKQDEKQSNVIASMKKKND